MAICPGCQKDVKGNFCPDCKKTLSLGGIGAATANKSGAAPASSTAHLNRSAAMENKGSGPKTKDKTIEGSAKSNAIQSKYGQTHLVSKDAKSDFGNMTRSKRWVMAENIAMALLLVASIIGLVSFFLPFYQVAHGTLGADGTPVYEYVNANGMEALKDTPFSTVAMIGFVAMIVVLAISLLKLVGIVVKPLGDILGKTPVAIAQAVLSILALTFAILVFTSVAGVVASQGFEASDGTPVVLSGNPGVGTLLLLIAGIGSIVIGILGALTRLKLNTLNDKAAKGPSGAM